MLKKDYSDPGKSGDDVRLYRYAIEWIKRVGNKRKNLVLSSWMHIGLAKGAANKKSQNRLFCCNRSVKRTGCFV
jgi:hypothetical protein